MSTRRQLIRLITIAGPTAYRLLRKYGPEVRQALRENPELLEAMRSRVFGVTNIGNRMNNSNQIQERVGVLREQVVYLYGTARSPYVARQAKMWRAELDSIEKSAAVLTAMSNKKRFQNKRHLQARLDVLSQKILQLTLEDPIEDVEFTEE